jgi:glycosyltransferase involved in cell wall biosynthesis
MSDWQITLSEPPASPARVVPSRPTVSALISLYRSESFIESFLYRLAQQTILSEVELIFVVNVDDDHPGQAVLQALEACSVPHKQVVQVAREGIYASWNRAIRLASGQYLCNLNHDDYHFYDSLQLLKSALDQHPQLDLCFGLTRYTAARLSKADFDHSCRRRRLTQVRLRESSQRHRVECCPMWRAALHDEVGLFDESYRAAGDHEMWVRMLAAGKRFGEIVEPTCVFHRHPDTLTARFNGLAEVGRIIDHYGEQYR